MYANDSLNFEDRSTELASLLTLTYVPDFQCPASYGHDPYQGQNQSRRLDGSKDLGVETKRTNRRTDGADLLASSLTQSVTVSLYYSANIAFLPLCSSVRYKISVVELAARTIDVKTLEKIIKTL